jgi:tetratricopeptide (TPR) repeat protein
VGYFAYYLVWMLVWRAVQSPWLAFGLLALLLAQRYLPDPWVWMRTAGRMRSLRQQVDANPANVTARRDLARLYIERGRPVPALALLAAARERAPQQADLLLLTGMAQLRAGKPEAALEPLVAAVDHDPRIAFGDPYRLAGDALRKLERWGEAEDAYQRYLEINSSSLEAWFRIYDLRKRLKREDEARAARDELFATWRQLPGYHRRKQWPWWLRAQSSRALG